MKISIKFKFIFIVALVEALFLAILISFSTNIVKKQEKNLFDSKKSIVKEFIKDILTTPLLTNDIATIEDSLKNIINKDQVSAMRVLNSNGDVLSIKCVDDCKKFFNNVLKNGENISSKKVYFLQNEKIALFDEIIGSIDIVFDITEKKDEINEFVNLMILIAIFEIFVVIIVGWYANYLILKSLNKIQYAAKDFAKKGIFIPLDVKTNDEIEEIANSFEDMEKTIIRQQNNLKNEIKIEVAKNREKDLIIIKQQRDGAIGETINMIAHQWRQPLNVLSLIFEDLKDAYEHGELNKEYFKKNESTYEQTITSLTKIIDNFREFFRPNEEVSQFYPLKDISLAQGIVSAEMRNNKIKYEINTKLDPENILILGFRDEFRRVFLGLFKNSIDALSKINLEEKIISIDASIENNRFVISVQDNGIGIKESIKDKIFEPYFTTKENDIGKGMGLYMAKMVLKSMKASLELDGNYINGARFLIIFDEFSMIEK